MGTVCCAKQDENAYSEVTTHKDQQQLFFIRQKSANKVKRHVEEVGLVKDQIGSWKKGLCRTDNNSQEKISSQLLLRICLVMSKVFLTYQIIYLHNTMDITITSQDLHPNPSFVISPNE